MPDMSLAGFMDFLAQAPVRIEKACEDGLRRIAVQIEKEAKREIGTYQDAAGPFAAWEPLKDSTVEDKEREGYAPPDNPLLRGGDMRGSIDHRVEGMEAVVGSNSPIAEYQELGTSRIPARSFLGGAAFREAPKVAEALGGSVVLGLIGRNARTEIPSE